MRHLYVYRLTVEIPVEFRWPNEPPTWVEVYERHGWDAEPHDPEGSGFHWPSWHTHYLSRSGARKRAAFLRDLGATVAIERSNRVTWRET